MKKFYFGLFTGFLLAAFSLTACKKPEKKKDDEGKKKSIDINTSKTQAGVEEIAPWQPPKKAPDLPLDPQLKAPDDVAAPPKDAEKTELGIFSKVLLEGKGKARPGASDVVRVHYTGWTTDGQLVDTTKTPGKPEHMVRPATFPLDQVMPGWAEGIRLMVIGEKRRLWIPEELGFKGQPSAPKGMLVYDMELMEIIDVPDAPTDLAKPPASAKKTESGLTTRVVKKGKGKENPGPDSLVTFNYSGWTTDGKMFDSTVVRGKPATIKVGNVFPGWVEGLQMMVVGEQRRMWVPADMAPPPPPNVPAQTLVFDVELLEIKEMPKAPADVAAPPADAKKTPSGLAYKVLEKGSGTEHPTSASEVTVHYTGWTTDGKMFDSSLVSGEPVSFALKGVIKGWTEGVPLMVEGEKALFWIPEELAYKGQQNRPQGMLVFEIELVKIL